MSISKGRLTVTEAKGARYKVSCECGNVFMSWKSRWDKLTGRGCKKCISAIVGRSSYIHRGTTLHPGEYNSWRAMKARCNDPNYRAYSLYGGRGIKVCERWKEFSNFLEDMGDKPSPKHTIDRIDSNGDYTPDNCKWSDQFEQMGHTSRNRFITINGVNKHASEWARFYGVNIQTVYSRAARRGVSVEDIFLALP